MPTSLAETGYSQALERPEISTSFITTFNLLPGAIGLRKEIVIFLSSTITINWICIGK